MQMDEREMADVSDFSGDTMAFGLADLLDCLGRWSRAAQYTRGLNPAQWESLRFLAGANRFSRSPGALAKYLGVTRGTASQTLIALEKKGYVRRERDQGDGRVILLDLTQTGRDLLEFDPLACLDSTLMARINDQDAKAIIESLGHVLRCFQAAELGQSFGTCQHCGHFVSRAGDGDLSCGLKKANFSTEDAAGICINFAPRELVDARS